MTASPENETLLERTNREFNAAVLARDYARAMQAVRWVYRQRTDLVAEASTYDEAADQLKRMTPQEVAANLRTSVLCASSPDPALLLYVADLLEGANLGRRPDPTKVIINEVKLLVRIGELFEQTDGSLKMAERMEETYRLAAAEGFGNHNVDTVRRLYRRAKQSRATG